MPRIFVYFACCCSFTLPRARAEGEGLSGEGVHRGIAQQGRERKTDCRDEGKQSAQELANEFSCGNLSPPQPSEDAAIRKNNTRNLSKETKCEHAQKNQHAAYPEIIWVQLTWPRSELSCSHADAPLLLCPPTPGRSADLHLTCLAPP